MKIEQYYLDLLKPEYNILRTAGSPYGRKHSAETRAKISAAKLGSKHPLFGKTLTEEIKQKLSAANTGKNNPMFGKARPAGAGRLSQPISVIDIKNNKTTIYASIREAARAL